MTTEQKLREALERIAALNVPINIVDVMDPVARKAVEIAADAIAQPMAAEAAKRGPQELHSWERKAFEEEYRLMFPVSSADPEKFEQNGIGGYEDFQVNNAWRFWQARALLAADSKADREARRCEIFSCGEWVDYPLERYEEAKASGQRVRKLYAISEQQADSKAGGEPNWKHPTIQGLIGADARNRITIDLIWKLIEDPGRELTPGDMEYWDAIHDALKAALTRPQQQAKPLMDEDIRMEYMRQLQTMNEKDGTVIRPPGFTEGIRFAERAHGIGDQS